MTGMQRFALSGCQNRMRVVRNHTPMIKKGGSAYIFFLLPALLVYALSCSKQEGAPAGNGCISRVEPLYTQTTLTNSQIDSIKTLFANNNLSANQLQFTVYLPDTHTGLCSIPQEQVTAIVFINGLPVFGSEETYIFNNGLFQDVFPAAIGTPQTNDSSGRLSLTYLQGAFLDHVSESFFAGGPANSKPFIPSPNKFKDSCLLATLGYLDAASIPGNSTPVGTTLVKVWKLTPLNGSYPLVYVEDDNGSGWGVPLLVP
jgi:hypothetical protein